jgi:hypothetical protein
VRVVALKFQGFSADDATDSDVVVPPAPGAVTDAERDRTSYC